MKVNATFVIVSGGPYYFSQKFSYTYLFCLSYTAAVHEVVDLVDAPSPVVHTTMASPNQMDRAANTAAHVDLTVSPQAATAQTPSQAEQGVGKCKLQV